MNSTSRFRQFAIGMSLTVALTLSACSNGDPNKDAVQTSPVASEAPSVQPSEEATETPAAEPSKDNNGNEEQAPSNEPEAAVTVGSLVELAKVGKVPGCDYAAHTALYDEIEKKWGKADDKGNAGKGMYAVYNDKGITFGYNKGMIVFDVRAYSKELQTLTVSDIEKALGKADETTANGTDDIYTYQVNDQYQLKFVIAEETKKVDHISVYSPQDAKNNMAG